MIALLLVLPAAAYQPAFVFDTAGGDAWTLRKTIAGVVFDGRCDDVVITSPRSSVVARPDHDRVAAEIALESGDNRISAQCRRNGAAVGEPVVQAWNVRVRDVPRAIIHTFIDSGRILLDGASSKMAPARAEKIIRYEWRGDPGNPTTLTGLPGQGSTIVIPAPAEKGEYRVHLTVTDAAGRSDESAAAFRERHGAPEAIDVTHHHPRWQSDAVIYGVVPKLFGREGLADVTARLDHLAALGINTLWLSPVTGAPHGDFGYAVTDFFHVRASLGGGAALSGLIRAAHQRGMHVLLDFAANDVAMRHPYFQSTVTFGRHSPYFDYFQRKDDGKPIHYFNWNNLENLNYANPEVQRMAIVAAAYWVRKFHIDGFRVDAAWGPRQRTPTFWPRWSAELKRINPDLLLIAEASASDPYYRSSGFDAAYDWTARLGEWSWGTAFADKAHTARLLQAAIAASPGSEVLRFLDNNDTGSRFVTRYGLPRTRVAAAMLLTLPGLPALYTGDEVGASYKPYETVRPIGWSDPDDLKSWYGKLITLRHRHSALRSSDIQWLSAAPADNMMAYLRGRSDRPGRILVLLNYGPKLAVFDRSLHAISDGPAMDIMSGEKISADKLHSGITVEGFGVRIIKLL